MKFDKSKIDEELRAKGEVIHFVLPHYTKTKMKIVDKISSLIFKGKKPTDDDIDYKQIYIDRKVKSKLRVCLYSNKNSSRFILYISLGISLGINFSNSG